MTDSPIARHQTDPTPPCYYHQDVRDTISALQQRIDMVDRERHEDLRRLEAKINTLIVIMTISVFISGGILVRDIIATMLRVAV